MLVTCALIDRPLRFDNAGEVFHALCSITKGWSFAERPECDGEPFIRVLGDDGVFVIQEDGREAFCEDSVASAACSLIVILLNRMVEPNPALLCLHASAVAIGEQAVVFPSTHRAGKSTLAAALAFAGRKLVADDILPINCAGSETRAMASGVAPRLRFPFPSSLGWRFRFSAWRFAVIDDGYYRYVQLPSSRLCPFGDHHHIGAFVFLERDARHCDSRLHAVGKADAMRILLLQNFGTAAPPDAILERIDSLAQEKPAFLLCFSELDGAVSIIADSFAGASDAFELWKMLTPAEPDLGRTAGATPRTAAGNLPADRIVCHSNEVVLRQVEGSMFLADVENGAIFALNPLGALIWRLIEEPASSREIANTISDAFPDITRARVVADIDSLIDTLLAKRLAREVG